MVRGSSQFRISNIHFCILLYYNISRSLDFLFLNVLGSPWADIEFFFVVIWRSFPKTTAPITQKLCRHVSQRIRCRCFAFFATCSHSFSLAPTRHLKLHLGWFPWNAKWNPHIFLSDKMQPWIPRAKHNGSNFSHSLSLALSLLIFFMLNRVLHREQNSSIPQMPSRTGIPRLARWRS